MSFVYPSKLGRHATLAIFVALVVVCQAQFSRAAWGTKRLKSSPFSRVRTKLHQDRCSSGSSCRRLFKPHCGRERAYAAGKTSPGGPSQPVWIPLFDGRTLTPWEVAVFGGEGEVSVEDGQIQLGFGDSLTGITRKGDFPKSDYEIRLEAMRVDGIDFFCALTFPVQDSHCTFVVGGWAGAVVGLSNIDGRDASENKTTRYMAFDDNRWYRIRVRVTADKIQAWIDDERMVDQGIQGRRIAIRPEVDLCKPLGIASWQTRAVLRKIEYRRLTESD